MRWILKPKPESEKIRFLQESLQVNEIIASLLIQRGIETYEEAKAFFRPNLNDLHDPFLMKDMDKAVERVERAIQNNENILVYGDYDVDGTTSVALLSLYLKEYSSNVATYIPDRYDEGYGISFKGIDFAEDNDFSLIIALDCGIKAIDKVDYASAKGIDFIICDHHRPGDKIPNAIAVLDPKRSDCNYPFKELCGCGVGFKLITALELNKGGSIDNLISYLDLVSIAIAADIVPMYGENRILSFHGLQVINSSPRPGIKAVLAEVKKEELSVTDVVFIIAPRINAAGRMKHGNHAVTLLAEEDDNLAASFAVDINRYNLDRRDTDKTITEEALELIEKDNETERFTTVVCQEHWHKGVIGIVASRLIETYYRPTIVFTKSGNRLAASARSVKGFDVYNALSACKEYIEQYGGHKYAAGLTILEENYDAFKAKFEEVVKTTIDPKLLVPQLQIDMQIQLNQIDDRLWRILKQFAPFGPGNMTPVFMTNNLKDTGYGKCVGEDDKHLRLTVTEDGNRQKVCIGFGLGPKINLTSDNKRFKAAYTIDENHWNGNTTLQLKLKDIKA
ncbi:MAG: single-stranded-DNA-specific exonuclease RecJ [Winogradskyella sp.]|nr:single-stranded-DNA-specific exonuclease RecJ [Winogradskyella sp.]